MSQPDSSFVDPAAVHDTAATTTGAPEQSADPMPTADSGALTALESAPANVDVRESRSESAALPLDTPISVTGNAAAATVLAYLIGEEGGVRTYHLFVTNDGEGDLALSALTMDLTVNGQQAAAPALPNLTLPTGESWEADAEFTGITGPAEAGDGTLAVAVGGGRPQYATV